MRPLPRPTRSLIDRGPSDEEIAALRAEIAELRKSSAARDEVDLDAGPDSN